MCVSVLAYFPTLLTQHILQILEIKIINHGQNSLKTTFGHGSLNTAEAFVLKTGNLK